VSVAAWGVSEPAYVSTITLRDASGSYLQLAGSMEQPTIQSIGGQPHFRGNFTTTYSVGPTTLSATARYVGGGKLRNEWGPLDINQVTSSSRTYLEYSRRATCSIVMA
jgi:iron complex outermembrane receptor protein